MEPFLSIELCICYDALTLHPMPSHLLKVIKTVPMTILVNDSVFDSQASGTNRNSCFAVRLPQDVSLCPLAVRDARIG